MGRLISVILAAVVVAIVSVIVGAIMALPVMLLFNFLFTGADSIVGYALPEIGFLRAWALMILTGILFKPSTSAS